MRRSWRDIIRARIENEGFDFNKLNKVTISSNDSFSIEDENSNINERDSPQFNMSFYERGRPIIEGLDAYKTLVAIELYGLIPTKTEEEAGELLWVLMVREMNEDEIVNIRSLWLGSRITMEEGRTKKSAPKLLIKVDGVYEDTSFIIKVWNLLHDVCVRTGL